MTRTEFIEKYGDVKVEFSSYYKYTFTFCGSLPNGDYISVDVGGSSDDIYRMTVEADIEESIVRLNPFSGSVFSNDVEIESFYDY